MKKRKRLIYKYYLEAKERLFNNGTTLDNDIYFDTTDYNFKNFINLPIKDFKKAETEFSWKEDDESYYNNQMNTNLYENINLIDTLYADWWRIGSKSKNKLIYLSISTPEIKGLSDNYIDYEIFSLIREHYFKTFGYGTEFYIEPTFRKIKSGKYKNSFYELFVKDCKKDTSDLIKEWVHNNKNSIEYNYYKNLIIEGNKESLSLKEPYLCKFSYEINNYQVVVPFNYDLTFPELFKLILNNKIKILNKLYNKNYINIDFENKKDFLYQFKPIKKEYIIKRKKIKRKGTKK